MDKENELINLRKQLSSYSNTKNISSTLVNFTLAVLLTLFSYVFPYLFGNTDNKESIVIIQYVFYFVSFIFLLISVNSGLKILNLAKRKNEVDTINKIISDTIADKDFFQEEMKKMKFNKEDSKKKLVELTEQLNLLDSNLNHLKEHLTHLTDE